MYLTTQYKLLFFPCAGAKIRCFIPLVSLLPPCLINFSPQKEDKWDPEFDSCVCYR